MGTTFGTFNLKDFFPQAQAQAGLPAYSWEAKVGWTARMIARMEADVLALQEVGDESTLDALARELERHGLAYRERVVGTPDARGIRVALLTKLPLVRARVHTADALPFPVFVEGDAPPFGARIPLRRGVVVAQIDAPGLGLVDVVVAHFKSRRAVPLRTASGEAIAPASQHARAEADARSTVWRATEALCVRALADEALASRPDAMVAVMGDLNDTIASSTLAIVRGDDRFDGHLASCARMIPQEQAHTILFSGAGSQIDHVLASAALASRQVSAAVLNEELREHAFVAPEPLPLATPALVAGAPEKNLVLAKKEPPPTVDSDHAPLLARFA